MYVTSSGVRPFRSVFSAETKTVNGYTPLVGLWNVITGVMAAASTIGIKKFPNSILFRGFFAFYHSSHTRLKFSCDSSGVTIAKV